MSLYLGNKKVSGLHIGSAAAGTTPIALAKPTINVNANTGVITATVTQSSAGYVNSGSSSNTLALTTKAGTAITPNSTTQTAVAKNVYTLGAVTVKPVPTEEKTVTANGEYTPTSGKYFSKVKVNIDTGIAVNNQANKDVTPSAQTQTVQPDSGYTGLAQVTVNPIPSNYIIPSGNKEITANGTGIDVTNYATVSVEVPTGSATPALQTKTVTPTESAQTISPDSEYDGLSSVTVNAISTTYVGSGIARRTSADLVFTSNDNLFDSNSTVVNAYIVSGTGKLTSSGSDRAVIIPLAINTEYTFTWNRTAINNDTTDDVNIGVFTAYPAVGSIGRYIGSTKTTGGTITFTTTSAEHYVAIKIAQVNKTDFDQTFADSTLYATSGNVISAPAGYYANGAFTVVPTETKSITTNGTFTPSTGKLISSVTVNVPTGSTINNQDKTITPTETEQTVTADSGYSGLGTVTVGAISKTYIGTGVTRISNNSGITINGATVSVRGAAYYTGNVSKTIPLQAKTATPTTSSQEITPDSAYSGLSKVTISAIPSDYIIPSGSQTVTSNDTYDVTSLAELVVNVPTGATINNQDKTVTPSESQQSISADSEYTGLGTVTVNAISSDYVGSGITTRSSADLTASGATVSVPAGYYSAAASKAVASGSAKTPATTITANPDISINSSGLITATTSASKNITPTVSAGYVSSGTAGTVTVSGSDTLQLTTLGAKTYNVSSSNQTITSGKYLTGTQTIRAVTTSNISAANIKAGVVVKVGDSADDDRITAVTGTFTSDATASAADINSGKTAYVNGNKITGAQVIQRFYTGSSAPTSSLGSNGDIYLQE